MNIEEQNRRSVLKAITFRIIVICFDFTVAILITGRYDLALGIVLISNTIHTILYYFHERFWNKVKWGREKIL